MPGQVLDRPELRHGSRWSVPGDVGPRDQDADRRDQDGDLAGAVSPEAIVARVSAENG
jgi:hypothetical protein